MTDQEYIEDSKNFVTIDELAKRLGYSENSLRKFFPKLNALEDSQLYIRRFSSRKVFYNYIRIERFIVDYNAKKWREKYSG